MRLTDFSSKNSPMPPSLIPGRVVVIDAGFGNVRSVLNALESLGSNACLSRNPVDLRAADALILPGVGAFTDGMKQLRQLELVSILEDLVLNQGKPFLGICLGMQLLARRGDEGGECTGLGWIEAEVTRFSSSSSLKIPHVGWNDVIATVDDPLLGTAGTTNAYYFVHSYHLQVDDPALAVGTCEYGANFPAVIRKNNVWGAQFHPEKSHRAGLRLLANFLGRMKPESTQEDNACSKSD